MSDEFTGNWLVTEYVYNPDGVFAGIVHQKRRVEPLDENRLRVIQDCYPSEALDNHPMASFRGHWEFDVHKNDKHREYHGEDVIGTGYSWSDHAMTGQGIWTRFGYNFTSFGVVTRANRQLTGGTFLTAHVPMCKIIGIAVPEKTDAPEAWVTLSQEALPDSTQWIGSLETYEIKQGITQTVETHISVSSDGYLDTDYAKSMRYGCMQETIAYTPQGSRIETNAIYDAENDELVIIRLSYNHLTLVQVVSGVLKQC